MPLVLATGAPTLYEQEYEDIYGVQYEFPDRYKAMVAEGEPFLYYRGVRGAVDREGPVYLGSGIVGEVRKSANGGLWVAQVPDVTTFGVPVSFKDAAGNYWETGSSSGTNWANGVRRISDERYTAIVREGMRAEAESAFAGASGFHADPEHASRMERYSVSVAMALLADEFGADKVNEMPAGNPGYDISVTTPQGSLHVEVKGTVLPDPVFHFSEGQRRHARFKGSMFRLVVVYAIRLSEESHQVVSCRGNELEVYTHLEPASWTGVLLV